MDTRWMGRTASLRAHEFVDPGSRTQSTCRIIPGMKAKDESVCSRRTFVKSLSATAVSLMSGIGNAKPIEGQAASVAASDATWLSLSEASRLVKDKKISPVELTQGCLKRIERLNPSLNAFITVTAESA